MVTVAFQVAIVSRFKETVNSEEIGKVFLCDLAYLAHKLQTRVIGV